MVWTVAFAVLGVGLGARRRLRARPRLRPASRAVRVLCAFLRSVHELFWALLLIQVAGLSPLTGILAIATPLRRHLRQGLRRDDRGGRPRPPSGCCRAGTSTVSAFAYARLPELAPPFLDLHALPPRMRPALDPGARLRRPADDRLPPRIPSSSRAITREAAALLVAFYVLIGTRRLWARPATLPFLILGSLLVLPEAVGGGSAVDEPLRASSTHDIVPVAAARRRPACSRNLAEPSAAWFQPILTRQIAARRRADARAVADRAGGHGLLALVPVPVRLPPLRRAVRPAARARRARGRALDARIHAGLRAAAAARAVDAAGHHRAHPCTTAPSSATSWAATPTRSTTAPTRPSGLNLYCYETVPRLYGQFLAYMLYRWEIILRESAIFGILGVATLGYYVDAAISEFGFDVAFVLILATALLSMAVDALSRGLRRRLRIDAHADAPVRGAERID